MFLEELRVLDNYMCILINDVFTNLKRFEKRNKYKHSSQLFYCLESSSSILSTFVDINIKILSEIKFQLS